MLNVLTSVFTLCIIKISKDKQPLRKNKMNKTVNKAELLELLNEVTQVHTFCNILGSIVILDKKEFISHVKFVGEENYKVHQCNYTLTIGHRA